MQNNNINGVLEKRLCTGCGTCSLICPQGAIKMQDDSEGFKAPIVESEKCNGCGRCKRHCHAIKSTKKYSSKISMCLIAQNKEKKIAKKSASGGAFVGMAIEFLQLL